MDLLVKSTEIGHRQGRGGTADDGTKRFEGGFRIYANPDIEGAEGMLPFIEWEIRLLGVVAKSAVTEIRHDADNFHRWLGVGSSALADSHAERIAPCQVSLYESSAHDRRAIAWLARRGNIMVVE